MNKLEEVVEISEILDAMESHLGLLIRKAELEGKKTAAEILIDDLVARAVADGFVLGKNDDERKANKRARFPDAYEALDEINMDLEEVNRQIVTAREQREYYRLIVDYFAAGG